MHIAVSGLFLGAHDEQKNAGLQSTVWHFASSTNRAQPNNAMNFLFDRTKHVLVFCGYEEACAAIRINQNSTD